MGKVIDFWTGRDLPPEEPQRSYRIDQVSGTQLRRIAAFSEALGLMTPDDLQRVIREHRPEETDLHCHPFELTSEQAYRLVAILHTSTRQAGSKPARSARAGGGWGISSTEALLTNGCARMGTTHGCRRSNGDQAGRSLVRRDCSTISIFLR